MVCFKCSFPSLVSPILSTIKEFSRSLSRYSSLRTLRAHSIKRRFYIIEVIIYLNDVAKVFRASLFPSLVTLRMRVGLLHFLLGSDWWNCLLLLSQMPQAKSRTPRCKHISTLFFPSSDPNCSHVLFDH
jgi:hypothetical protein